MPMPGGRGLVVREVPKGRDSRAAQRLPPMRGDELEPIPQVSPARSSRLPALAVRTGHTRGDKGRMPRPAQWVGR